MYFFNLLLALVGTIASVVMAAPTDTTKSTVCQDGDFACVNWGRAVGYCNKNGWWIKEHCFDGVRCTQFPWPMCWNGPNGETAEAAEIVPN
jgi:hypothetical protein